MKTIKRLTKAHRRTLQTRWARAYCKAYGAPTRANALTWRTMGRKLAASGYTPENI